LRHHVVIWTVPYGRARIELIAIFASSTAQHGSDPGRSGGIVSSFRLIFIAALTAAMVLFVIDAAAAQSAADQSGKAYLAGLRPPHEHPKAAHAKTSRVASPQKSAKRQPTVAAKSKAHRPARLAQKINSRIAWPSVAPNAADESAASETVLQFATEDTTSTTAPAPATSVPASPLRAGSAPAAAPRASMSSPAASAARTAPPVGIAATDEHDNANPAADKPPGATTVARTERIEPPASLPMRVITPAMSEAPAAAVPAGDRPPAQSASSTAQMLATLAGTIAACFVAFMIFGFGSSRIRRI
jgi:hypothetical protein